MAVLGALKAEATGATLRVAVLEAESSTFACATLLATDILLARALPLHVTLTVALVIAVFIPGACLMTVTWLAVWEPIVTKVTLVTLPTIKVPPTVTLTGVGVAHCASRSSAVTVAGL